ncbi:uncharacterized protein LOC142983551 [Anticarsia gemmatalis]|uniref:uncharacterized protein LOC142983551 n=1 Tax=Anticarsia gemmatalis TaxID=129554 RepID=UPI003F763673
MKKSLYFVSACVIIVKYCYAFQDGSTTVLPLTTASSNVPGFYYGNSKDFLQTKTSDEVSCLDYYMDCMLTDYSFRLISIWDAYNNRWKFSTLCVAKSSDCLLGKSLIFYSGGGHNSWILV